MNERIHLQYTIKMSELPGEVERLIKKADKVINGPQNKAMQALVNLKGVDLLTLNTVKKLHEVQDSMDVLGHLLRDVENIVNGYVDYELQKHQQLQAHAAHESEQPSDPVETPAVTSAPLEDLAKKIKAFKEGLDNDHEKPAPITP